MSRSVSYATGSIFINYLSVEHITEDYMWDDYLAELTIDLHKKFKSLTNCNHWIGREDHAILENKYCYIGISEYCGLLSLWIVPKEIPLAVSWINKIEKTFKSFGELNKVGTFSNGESVYEKTGGN